MRPSQTRHSHARHMLYSSSSRRRQQQQRRPAAVATGSSQQQLQQQPKQQLKQGRYKLQKGEVRHHVTAG